MQDQAVTPESAGTFPSSGFLFEMLCMGDFRQREFSYLPAPLPTSPKQLAAWGIDGRPGYFFLIAFGDFLAGFVLGFSRRAPRGGLQPPQARVRHQQPGHLLGARHPG
mmetsp:Transcript_176098/g.564675  ORF Transcript_176098/g.564675 Transcript_176098/m.564675 type:complete len:108 (-) Transcript_176098:361-684(-)